MDLADLIPPSKAGAMAGINPRYLEQLGKEGRAPRPVRIGYAVFYRSSEIQQWLLTYKRYEHRKKRSKELDSCTALQSY